MATDNDEILKDTPEKRRKKNQPLTKADIEKQRCRDLYKMFTSAEFLDQLRKIQNATKGK